MKGEIIDKMIQDAVNGISYTHPSRWEKIKIFFGWKFKQKKIKEKSLMELIPRVKFKKSTWRTQ